MAFFGNKRKDFSIQPPRQQVDGTPFFVTDSANIDFTLANLNLTANLTQTGVTAGTYGDATHIPILVLDAYGRVTGISTTTFSTSGIALEVNGTPNLSQTVLNLTSGTDIQVVDLGGGVIEFNYTGTGGTGTVTSVSAGTGMSFTTITTSGSVAIDTTKVPYLTAGFSTGLLKWSGSAWVFDTSTYLTTISGLNISLLTNDSGYITSAALAGYVPNTRTLTINGVGYDLSTDRSWTISTGTGTVTSVGGTGTVAGLSLSGTVTSTGNITLSGTLSTPVSTINDSTTVGQNFVKLTNPSAITFIRINADNSISTLDASTFRTAIGAGTSSTSGTVTSVAALTLGTTGTDLTSTVANGTTTPVITLNVPTASATNRGALSAADWTTFNGKQDALTLTTTGTSGAATLVSSTLNIPQYSGGTVGNSIQALTGDVTASASSPSQSVAATLAANYKAGSAGVTFDGGGAVITNGKIAYVRVPYKGTITEWYIASDVAGACSILVQQGLAGVFPPATTIITAVLPSGRTANATGLSINVSAGDYLAFTISGVSTVTQVNLSLSITKIL